MLILMGSSKINPDLQITPTSPQWQVDFEVDDYRRKETKRQSYLTLPFLI
jgi:hypothetical protein